jgi:hypothetical protein
MASLRFVIEPAHTEVAPDMAVGVLLTVTGTVIRHPVVASVYVIAVTPAAIPPTTPEELIVATVVVLLLHVPPVVGSDKVIDAPSHTEDGPAIAPGKGFTVITVVASGEQPFE